MSARAGDSQGPHVGLVLAGGGARGAYEVGVARFLFEEVRKELGRDLPVDVFCGTSVGAINACALASSADDLAGGVARLAQHWTALRITDVIKPSGREMFAMLRGMLGSPSHRFSSPHRGGIFDPSGLERVVASAIPFERIEQHLRSRRIHAITVSATHVASGKTVIFVERADPGLPAWSNDGTVMPHAVRLKAPHALASAAIPLLFPAVKVEGELYCDGGLRQNVPLSPARRLGADGLIVVNPRHIDRKMPLRDGALARGREEALISPLFLMGKALNALMLDRIDNDLDRLNRINTILEAGSRRYGADFVSELNRELGYPPGEGVRPLRTVLIRSSEDIGKLSAAYVRTPAFKAKNPGMLGRLIHRMAEGDAENESDLLSYVLFDGDFARQLMDLGLRDARARREELLAFFATLAPRHRAER